MHGHIHGGLLIMAGDYCPLCFDHDHYGDGYCPRCNDHEHYSAMESGQWDPNIAADADGCPGWWLIMATIVITATCVIKKK